MTPITTVIVTFNSAGDIQAAVRSALEHTTRVIVVDNASTDATLSQIVENERVEVIANPQNRGFAGGVNQGVAAASTEFVLLLNPDAELLDPLFSLVDELIGKRHSAGTGLLIGMDDFPQQGFSFRRLPTPMTLAFEVLAINRIWPGNPVNRRYRCRDLSLTQPHEVEQPAGAFFLFRRSDWERLGGFDEGFHPVWFEDVDFCQRLVQSGGSIWFDPSFRAKHRGGHSVQKIDVGAKQRYWYGSLLRYAAKHFPPMSRRMVAMAVAASVVPRALVGVFLGRPAKVVSTQFTVLRLAWRHFWRAGSAWS